MIAEGGGITNMQYLYIILGGGGGGGGEEWEPGPLCMLLSRAIQAWDEGWRLRQVLQSRAAGKRRASDLAEGIDEDGAHRQALHALLVAPEADVIFEGQQVKDGVQQ